MGARSKVPLLLLQQKLLLVELKLISLQDVSIGASALSGPRSDAGQQATASELRGHMLIKHSRLLSRSHALLRLLGRLLVVLASHGFAQDDSVASLIPLLEQRGINLYDGVLDQRLGADHLIAGRVEHNVENTSLARAALRSPCEVTRVQAQGPVLHVPTTAADRLHTLGTDLGARRGATHFILALLDVHIPATTCEAALVTRIPRDA
jgi:hypothetical protein